MNEAQVYEAVTSGELEIDEQGRVWRIAVRRWGRIDPVPRRRAERHHPQYRRGRDGYLLVTRKVDGIEIATGAHRLVWLHFNGKIPDGQQINHVNGSKQDNRPENLELVTGSENVAHAHRTGLKDHRGENNPWSIHCRRERG